MEIIKSTSTNVINYVLDLFNSNGPSKLYRSKIMVIGYQNSGKTTLLDSLFPIRAEIEKKRKRLKGYKRHKYQLQGKLLKQFPDDETPHGAQYLIEDKKWQVIEVQGSNIELILKQIEGGDKELKFKFDNQTEKDIWLKRFKHLTRNSSTHGIDIERIIIENEKTKAFTGGENLELTVWDFAGQIAYYENLYHFVSVRTVFLVVWNVSLGKKGIQDLEYWFKSLRSHLPAHESHETQPLDFSIICVGTHLDKIPQNARAQTIFECRKEIEQTVLTKCKINFPIFLFILLDNFQVENKL